MPNYRFQVKAQDGKIQSGTIAADSATAAAAILRNQGVHVLAVDQDKRNKQGGGLADTFAAMNNKKPTQKQVLDFTTQLSVMIRAGINLRAALDGIADQTEHRSFKKVINELKADVESGKQFSEALQRHPKLFGPLYINMVRASEMSGIVLGDARPHRRLHRPADRDQEDGHRCVDLPRDHRHDGRDGDGVPAHLRAAQVLHDLRGQGGCAALGDQLPDDALADGA